MVKKEFIYWCVIVDFFLIRFVISVVCFIYSYIIGFIKSIIDYVYI